MNRGTKEGRNEFKSKFMYYLTVLNFTFNN